MKRKINASPFMPFACKFLQEAIFRTKYTFSTTVLHNKALEEATQKALACDSSFCDCWERRQDVQPINSHRACLSFLRSISFDINHACGVALHLLASSAFVQHGGMVFSEEKRLFCAGNLARMR